MKISRMFSSWMERHVNDGYVKQAKRDGYRSRSAFKLLEMDTKLHLLKPGSKVLELGSSPGGWTQVLVNKLKFPESTVTAVDILPMLPIIGVNFLQLDMTLESSIQEILKATANDLDLVLSDMSSNHSGIADIDCMSLIELHLMTLKVSQSVLKPGGTVLMKMLHGGEEPEHFVMIT